MLGAGGADIAGAEYPPPRDPLCAWALLLSELTENTNTTLAKHFVANFI